MTNDTAWGECRLRGSASRRTAWPLPMDADFRTCSRATSRTIKTCRRIVTVEQSRGGKFLEQFVAESLGSHLDIAGPAWADHESASRDPGGTGAFVRTLIELIASYEPTS